MKDLIAYGQTRGGIGALVQVLTHDYLQRKLICILKAKMFILTPPLNKCNSGSPQNQPGTVQLPYKKKPLHLDPLLHLIRGFGRVWGANAYSVKGTKLTEVELISGLGLAREAPSHRPICLEAGTLIMALECWGINSLIEAFKRELSPFLEANSTPAPHLIRI
jgi:hypothetical protein